MQIIKAAKIRENEDSKRLVDDVAGIIARVRREGDAALIDYNTRFDGNARTALRVSGEEIKRAYSALSEREVNDLKAAADHIRLFASAQKGSLKALENIEPIDGVRLGHRVIPVQSACCYVPGGGYPLYSTALMLAIPARVAGVKKVTACSPAMKGTKSIHPKVLAALDIAGADEIYAVGGAHGVAAFAYGTDQIPAVDIIVGPGNQYVTEAKRQCYGQVGIDFIAGPSEVLVVADETADPEILAADLLGQSEHDLLAKGILVTTDRNIAQKTMEAVEIQLKTLETAAIAAKSWADYGEVILADGIDEAIKIANDYAPEHLELIVKNQDDVLERLVNYGALFIGQTTAEVFGDYVSGSNHTLPTLRAARYTGGVWAGTFLKVCTHQRLTNAAMKGLAPLTSRMARGEGLIAHARAAEIRAEKL
ncbi:histidinol dehydrogenase [Christensenellaceae bacterium OttesenSCG-928-M15]|nr:histidinol dehydrogenase [Christensenellaceae bacterium OttesenSCG-928-M15]